MSVSQIDVKTTKAHAKPKSILKADVNLEQPKLQDNASDCEEDAMECAVCLQSCVHPVELPCNHVFCFLCVKGVAIQSKKCALCRQEIPADYFNNPTILREDHLYKDTGSDDGHQWYYEGRGGWWQYDERTSKELEMHFKDAEVNFELLIAGSLYIIDLGNMMQIRRNDPTRRRRMKRDLVTIEKKGVAGLKITSPSSERVNRDSPEGGETDAGSSTASSRKLPAIPSSRGVSGNRYPGIIIPVTTNTASIIRSSSIEEAVGGTEGSPIGAASTQLPDNIQALANQISEVGLSMTSGTDNLGNVHEAQGNHPVGSPSNTNQRNTCRPRQDDHSLSQDRHSHGRDRRPQVIINPRYDSQASDYITDQNEHSPFSLEAASSRMHSPSHRSGYFSMHPVLSPVQMDQDPEQNIHLQISNNYSCTNNNIDIQTTLVNTTGSSKLSVAGSLDVSSSKRERTSRKGNGVAKTGSSSRILPEVLNGTSAASASSLGTSPRPHGDEQSSSIHSRTPVCSNPLVNSASSRSSHSPASRTRAKQNSVQHCKNSDSI